MIGPTKTLAKEVLRIRKTEIAQDRFKIPVSDEELPQAPFVPLNDAQRAYLKARRDALGSITQYSYDLAGRLASVIAPDGAVSRT